MKTSKKPAVKKAVKITEPKKVKTAAKAKTSLLNVSSELSKIGEAYTEAINGKLKFSKVKEMLKKLHREVKKSSKK